MRSARAALEGLRLLLACFPAFQCLFDLFNMWPGGTNLAVLFCRDLSQIHHPQPVWFGVILICLPLCSSAGAWHCCLPVAYLFLAIVSKFIHTLFASFLIWERFPGYWRGKGGFSTHLSFVLRGENDMPFIVQINDQISTSDEIIPARTNSKFNRSVNVWPTEKKKSPFWWHLHNY